MADDNIDADYQNNDYYAFKDPNSTPMQRQSMEYSGKDPIGHLDEGLYGRARKQFIMKVYIILTIQLLLTAAMCFASFYSQTFLQFQIQYYWLMWVCVGIMLITEITIFCCPAGRKFPINMVLLFLFTLCEGYVVSYICAIVAEENGNQIVVVAAVMTFAIVFGLSMYAIFTPSDFTVKWGIVIVILIAMLMLGIFSIFAWSPFLNDLYCTLGVILFGIYLVIDTQLIVGGRTLQLSMDDYVVGALLIYIDIIQIFLYLLALLGKK